MIGEVNIPAVLLASAGIYGVMHYVVAQRTNEIGLRMALGARQGDVLCVVLGQGLRLAATGITIGLAGSIFLTRLLSSLLFGTSPTDPFTFAGVSFIFLAVTLAAC